jgi:ribosomal 50S subunit-recycling heat shock protein
MDIEIIVIGESGKRVLSDSRIRIGQDPNCEVSLPPGRYPAVAGVHLTLEVVNGAVSLARGVPLGGETFVNGHPAAAGAAIRSGDILRLGAGGPELRIRLLEQEDYAPPAQHEPTRVLNHEPTRVISGPAAAAYSPPPPVAPAAVGRQGYTAEAVRGVSAAPRTPVPQPAANVAEGEDMSILEGKLKSLQGILVASLLMILVLLGCNIWQSWELSQTRDDVQLLRTQAQNAVGQFTPALDARLKALDDRLDGMDAQVAQAQDRMVKTMDAQTKREEDRLVERMNTAIPAMLDKYITNKYAEMKR